MLIKCSNCGNTLNDTDTGCIMCGYDINTIKFQNKENELIKEGKIKSKKKSTIIIVLELLVFLVLAITYIKLFIPSIIDVLNDEQHTNNIKHCERQGGVWENNSCIYDY